MIETSNESYAAESWSLTSNMDIMERQASMEKADDPSEGKGERERERETTNIRSYHLMPSSTPHPPFLREAVRMS